MFLLLLVSASMASGVPVGVKATLKDARESCSRLGGLQLSEGAVRKVDLTGDGRSDYIVDERGFGCSKFLSTFQGTAGGQLKLFLARQRSATPAFLSYQRHYKIIRRDRKNALLLFLHGGPHCGTRSGAEECVRHVWWNGKTFVADKPRPAGKY